MYKRPEAPRAEHYLSKLQKSMATWWDGLAVCDYHGQQYTFGELARKIERIHLAFEAVGIKKGDKITLCGKNSANWAVSFLSISTYEAVVVPLLADFLPEAVERLTDHSDSIALFTDPEMFEKLDVSKMPQLRYVISLADFTPLWGVDDVLTKAYATLDDRFNAKFPGGFDASKVNYPTDNDTELNVINYTSGSTGNPKGVMLRYECFSATIDFGQRYIPCSNADNIVSMLPMGHIYGLTYEFLYPLISGVTVYYLGKTPSPSLLLKAMQEVQPYIVITVPLVMEKVYKSSIKPVLGKWYMKVLTAIPGISGVIYKKVGEKLQSAFGGKVREFVMGGAALNPEVEHCFRKIKLPYTVGYGMTEAAPLLAYEHPVDYAPGSCGKAVDCADVRIDSEDPENIAGEIQAKGTNVCSGYYKYPEADSAVFTEDGYLHTGDLGTIDANGNIFIRGRSKSMILGPNGQNIYPEEVEAAVNQRQFVAESVVVDRAGKLVALVYLDADGIKKAGLDEEAISDIPEQVRRGANRHLPSYSQITKVEVVLQPFEKTPKMSIKRFLYK